MSDEVVSPSASISTVKVSNHELRPYGSHRAVV
jgi:hypothetical protein